MQYWILQVFLTSRERPPIIEATRTTLTPRDAYLRGSLTAEHSFLYLKRPYIYRFYSELDGVVAAAIGHSRTLKLKPKPDFQSEDMTDWETANVFFDFATQRVAIQHTPHIQPLRVFRAFTEFLNRRDVDSDWVVATNPVSEANEFWQAAEKNKGKITELDLTYIPPNIWKGQSETEKALKEIHAETNNDEAEIRLRNRDGKLEVDSERIKESVEYVTKGGGRAVLRAGKRKVFDTDSAAVTESPEDDAEVEGSTPDKLRALIKRIFRKP